MTAFQFHAPLHTTACAAAVMRCSTSHDARHHLSWRHLPSDSSSPNMCRVPWHVPLPLTDYSGCPHTAAAVRVVADYTLPRRHGLYCAVYYHYHYCSPMRTSLNASTARRHVPPSRVVTSQLRAALATQRAAQSFKFKMSVAKHQACFITKLQGQNLATFSHTAVTPIAYLQHTLIKHALITR